MSRLEHVAYVVLAGLVAGVVAHLLDFGGSAAALCFLAAGIVLGELLVLRLEDGSAVPLSFAVLVVLSASFSPGEYASAVIGAELISLLLRITDREEATWPVTVLVERIAVAGATFGAYRVTSAALGHTETVAAVLGALGAAAAAQVIVDVIVRAALRMGETFSPRGRLAWLAIASSGMLMAIGYRGVGGKGEVGVWGPLLFSTPLLGAWYAFERLDSATRAYRQTIEALAMAPELGGIVSPGHAERVAALSVAMADVLDLSVPDTHDLEMAARLHHLGQVTLDEPENPHDVDPGEVAAVTGAMLREIRPLAAAGDIVAGDTDEPCRRLAVQILRLASAYDDLTVGDHDASDAALETLRWAPGYLYDERVVAALERVLHDRAVAVG